MGKSSELQVKSESSGSATVLHRSMASVKRFLKKYAGLGFLVGGAAVINFSEYGLVCLLLIISACAFIVQVHDTDIFSKSHKLRRTIKSLGYAVTVLSLTLALIVIARVKGDKPWTNIKWDDLSRIKLTMSGYLPAIPLWVWGAAIVGIAITGGVIRLLRSLRQKREQERKLRCPDQGLHRLVEDDQKQIHHWFRITSVGYQTHFGDVPFIEFHFNVYNMAFVPVSVDDSIEGRILFYKNRQDRELDLRWAPTIKGSMPKNCRFRNPYQFTIRQDVTPSEADFIERQGLDSYFFVELKITISGDGFSDVKLGGNFSIEKNGYFFGDHPATIFGGDDTLWRDHEDRLRKQVSALITERDELKASLEKEKGRS